MKKILFLIILILSSIQSMKASHLCGGDMRIEQIATNQFKIISRYVEIKSSSSSGGNKTCKITDGLSGSLITSVTMNFDSSRVVFYKYPGKDSLKIHFYSNIVTLPNNTNGYIATINHVFAREANVNSIPMGSLIFSCQIPDPAIIGGNSNPKFVNYPDSLSFCVGNINNLDFSCTDPDGDSLVYSLIAPIAFTSSSGGKPFIPISYNTGYNLVNILGPGSVCIINSSTGIITSRSTSLGRFVVGVKCEEFRNGVKIGETVRDLPIPSLNCAGSATSGIKKNNRLDNFSVFPNPSTGMFTLKFESEYLTETKINIYSINGKIIHSEKLENHTIQFDLQHLKKGIYFATVKQKNRVSTKKIIIS